MTKKAKPRNPNYPLLLFQGNGILNHQHHPTLSNAIQRYTTPSNIPPHTKKQSRERITFPALITVSCLHRLVQS
jgi:hypothetical protein